MIYTSPSRTEDRLFKRDGRIALLVSVAAGAVPLTTDAPMDAENTEVVADVIAVPWTSDDVSWS